MNDLYIVKYIDNDTHLMILNNDLIIGDIDMDNIFNYITDAYNKNDLTQYNSIEQYIGSIKFGNNCEIKLHSYESSPLMGNIEILKKIHDHLIKQLKNNKESNLFPYFNLFIYNMQIHMIELINTVYDASTDIKMCKSLADYSMILNYHLMNNLRALFVTQTKKLETLQFQLQNIENPQNIDKQIKTKVDIIDEIFTNSDDSEENHFSMNDINE